MMVQWTCDKCGAKYQQPLPAKEVGHWCDKARKRKEWTAMKKVKE